MLVKLKFQFPEIVLGMLLAVAIFALGAVVFSSGSQPDNRPPNENAQNRPQEPATPVTYWRVFGIALTPIDVFTFLLFGATVGLGIVTALGISNQSKETRILQRAYITAEPLGINPYISKDGSIHKQIIGHVGFVNVGRLPARDIIIIQPEIAWHSWKNIPKEKDLELTPQDRLNVVVPPGTKMPFGTKPYSAKYLKKAGSLYVWGEIRYTDGFGKSRFTKFCHRYPCKAHELAPDGSLRIDAKYGRYHDYGNDAD
jgi:hypothetical protein